MLITIGESVAIIVVWVVALFACILFVDNGLKSKPRHEDTPRGEAAPRGRPKLPREDDMDPDDVQLLEEWWPEERWPELTTVRIVARALDWCDLRAIAGDEAEDSQIDEMQGHLEALVYQQISTPDQWLHAWQALVRRKRRQALLS